MTKFVLQNRIRAFNKVMIEVEFTEEELTRFQKDSDDHDWVSLEAYLLDKLYTALGI